MFFIPYCGSLKMYGVGVASNGIMVVPSFVKIDQLVKNFNGIKTACCYKNLFDLFKERKVL
jgi:hypothetical protein